MWIPNTLRPPLWSRSIEKDYGSAQKNSFLALLGSYTADMADMANVPSRSETANLCWMHYRNQGPNDKGCEFVCVCARRGVLMNLQDLPIVRPVCDQGPDGNVSAGRQACPQL